MCGIAGLVTKNINKEKVKDNLYSMLDAMKWRGPNGNGIYVDDNDKTVIGLAHCRLSIFDLTDNGKQPMASEDNDHIIIYNGEVYNFKEIRKELEGLGYRFKSECDTEVILYACREWGVKCAVNKFNGMFAFAFYDKPKGKMYIVRDRMGVKPLYYSLKPDMFAFASDLRALIQVEGLERIINKRALYGYLWNMYIPAPQTIYEDVYKLEAGVILEYSIESNAINVEKYWDIYSASMQKSDLSEEDSLNSLKQLLEDATKVRLEADVPVGVFLSGGIDSSLISALAAEQSSNSVNTYSIGFYEKKDDDAGYARKVSKILGTHHEELYCTLKDALNIIPEIPKAYSEPFADNSQIPTMLLSKLTREHVTVSLSGDGGDEFFCGYPTYIVNKQLYDKKLFARISANTIQKVVDIALDKYDYKRWKVDKFSNAYDAKRIINLDYISAKGMLDSILKTDNSLDTYWGDEIDNYYMNNRSDIVNVSMLSSIQYGLQDDMLVKVDRASMYYSLECRCPILDTRVVKHALSMPLKYKYKDNRLKYPLKMLLEKYVPRDIIDRPKSGFGVPINKWLHEDLKDRVLEMLDSDYIRKQGIFEVSGIEEFKKVFMNRPTPQIDRIAYTLLMFQLWYMEYIGSSNYKC